MSWWDVRAADQLAGRADVRLDNWESDEGRRVRERITWAVRHADGAARDLRGGADLLAREADALDAARIRWAARYSELINRGSSIPEDKV